MFNNIRIGPLPDFGFNSKIISQDNTKYVYHPQKFGRKSNRYKRYFKANTPPIPFIFISAESIWSATPVKKLDHSVRIINNQHVVTFYPRTNI